MPGMSVIFAVAWGLLGAWGVVNLSQGDWFVGTVMVACAVVGLWSLAVRVVADRRRRRRTGGRRP